MNDDALSDEELDRLIALCEQMDELTAGFIESEDEVIGRLKEELRESGLPDLAGYRKICMAIKAAAEMQRSKATEEMPQ